MAFTASVKNGFVLLSAISPLLLGFFLIMGSIFNNNIYSQDTIFFDSENQEKIISS